MLILILFLLGSNYRRKKAEMSLVESEQFLDSVLDNLPDMIFVKDAHDLRFVRLNRAAEKYFGKPVKEIIGKNDFDFFPQEEAEFFTRKDRETLSNRVLVDIPVEKIQTPVGERLLHTQKMPLYDRDGRAIYLLGISKDITEDIAMANERQELEEKLKQAQKMESIGTLAGGIAHDFNNILSSIIGYTELAQLQADKPEAVEKLLAGTLKGAERAKQLIRQILTFSRKGQMKHEIVALSDVVKEAVKLLRATLPSTVELVGKYNFSGVIQADSTQMQQVVMNLCTNGHHAMGDKGGTITVTVDEVRFEDNDKRPIPHMENGRYVELVITDTGKGMERETILRMFDPYFTTKGSDSGTGLGLAVVHGIVKTHGGYISVASEVGMGTSIHIFLPAAEGEQSETEKPDPETDLVIGGASPSCL